MSILTYALYNLTLTLTKINPDLSTHPSTHPSTQFYPIHRLANFFSLSSNSSAGGNQLAFPNTPNPFNINTFPLMNNISFPGGNNNGLGGLFPIVEGVNSPGSNNHNNIHNNHNNHNNENNNQDDDKNYSPQPST